MAVAAESSNSVLQALWSQSKKSDNGFLRGYSLPFPSLFERVFPIERVFPSLFVTMDSFALNNCIGRFSWKLDLGPNWRVLKAYQWRRRCGLCHEFFFCKFFIEQQKGQQDMMMTFFLHLTLKECI